MHLYVIYVKPSNLFIFESLGLVSNSWKYFVCGWSSELQRNKAQQLVSYIFKPSKSIKGNGEEVF
jgi:hypothetical protein